MDTNHNRIKVADLEINQPDKILSTNSNGELEFSDIDAIKIDSYNGLDYTEEGKVLDARQGKVLKDLIDNINTIIASDNINLNSLQEVADSIESIKISITNILTNYSNNRSWALGIDSVSTQNYTLTFDDYKKVKVFTNANPTNFIIPINSVIPIPIGYEFEFTQKGDGIVTIGGSGITFLTNISLAMVKGETRILRKIDTDTWTIRGSKNDISQLNDSNLLLSPKIWNTIFVNNITGNDSTAQFENPNKPFATMQKALEFQSSLEGYFPFDIKIIITSGGTYNMGQKMLSNGPNSETNILLYNVNITGIKGTPTLVFTNGIDVGSTTLNNVNIIHQQLTNVPISGGLKFNAGNPNSFININSIRFSNITGLGNVFSPAGLFQYVKINNIIIDSTCTNCQIDLSRINTLTFAKIDNITNNANSFSASSSNSIFSPPFQDFEFSSITNNSTVPISLWGEWSSTTATIKIGNISSPNALMRIPLGIAAGDYGVNTKLKIHFKDSIINNCWLSGNTLNSQCYVSGKAKFNYSLQTPFMTITRSRLNTDFSNKDTCVLKDLELVIDYSITPTNPIISIPNAINNGSAGMTNGEAQVILENVKIRTNSPVEIFRIPAPSKLDTPRLIVFRGFNSFDNSKELINIAVTPTEPKYIISQKATIYHPFNVLSNNPSLSITQEQSY
ncbi:hypothetical protein ASE40_21210 [Flavobacterium sp. Root935]|jgi:hypothetical protein|uniref:hypothetical protein n=1 Tax=unclassified Flavobacterium TaxID=196869 RepID=UPI00070BD37D|nr:MULTISPECIES: hypothetical protein [unclassified Flavobacterium]KRD58824.1 hypothetical protein ASE40_21210 [Flavobacterium sp. Root935]MDQ1164558.1 hypothetical protein [Flavobacterium sp. SORGH_AS_0622]